MKCTVVQSSVWGCESVNKYSRWKVLLDYTSKQQQQGCVPERERQTRLESGRVRIRVTGPTWTAFGPEAAFGLSVCPVATVLSGSEL